MTLSDYLNSPAFSSFQDETLRAEAIRAVNVILSRTEAIKRHQIHAIPAVIQGAEYIGLAEMAKKQKEKNANAKNKAFWTELEGLLSPTGTADISLFTVVKSLLLERGIIQAEDQTLDKKEQKQIRKRNNDLMKIVIDQILSVYFEHFNCHYFYRSQEGGTR